MRLLSFFLITLAFPMVLHLEEKAETKRMTSFCVPALGYCLNYNERIFAQPERDVDNYGGSLISSTYDVSGSFRAKVDALRLRPSQLYTLRTQEVEGRDPNFKQLDSTIGDDYYYLSVRTKERMFYFQAWSERDRLVQLQLEGSADLDDETWRAITEDFRVSFR